MVTPYVGTTILAVYPEMDIHANITGYCSASSAEYVVFSMVGETPW